MNRLTPALAALLLLLFSVPAVRAGEATTVRLSFASTFPGGMALIGEAATMLPQRIARASGGEIELTFHEPGKLVPAAQTLSAVADGRIDAGWGMVVLAGLLVGVGTRYGSGCTSGHGVCGLSRLSPRSLVATLAFMAAGFLVVFLLRHVF